MSPASTASCLYAGAIRHRRSETRRREFRYGLELAYLDLDEVPQLLGGRLLRRRPGLLRFRRRDYFGRPSQPLSQAVRDEVERQTGARPQGPIRLLTHLRSLGHCFNPVSFYYCFDPTGTRLEQVLAEVTNTPWGERRAYVLSAQGDGAALRGESAKALHVSPFLDMAQRYRWFVCAPADGLEVHIENLRDNQVTFDATLRLRRRELTALTARRYARRYPVPTLRVLALIYLQALKLWLARVPVHPHPSEGATR